MLIVFCNCICNYLNSLWFHFCRASWSRLFCSEYIGALKCQEPVLKCKNSQQKAITQQRDRESFQRTEKKYQGIKGFENFSFNNCQRNSGRSGRSASFEDSLDSAQIYELKKVFDERSTLSDWNSDFWNNKTLSHVIMIKIDTQ